MNIQVYVLCAIICLTNATQNVTETSELIVAESEGGGEEMLSQWMRRLFDHHHWRGEVLQNASQECRQHIREYVSGLKTGASWANKSK